MKTPVIYKIDIFILTQEILDRQFFIFSEIPFADTVSLSIDDYTSVLQNNYQIIKITESNTETFLKTDIGKYVLSWKDSDSSFKQLLINKVGKKVSVQYVNYDNEETTTTEQNKEDHINWEM